MVVALAFLCGILFFWSSLFRNEGVGDDKKNPIENSMASTEGPGTHENLRHLRADLEFSIEVIRDMHKKGIVMETDIKAQELIATTQDKIRTLLDAEYGFGIPL